VIRSGSVAPPGWRGDIEKAQVESATEERQGDIGNRVFAAREPQFCDRSGKAAVRELDGG